MGDGWWLVKTATEELADKIMAGTQYSDPEWWSLPVSDATILRWAEQYEATRLQLCQARRTWFAPASSIGPWTDEGKPDDGS